MLSALSRLPSLVAFFCFALLALPGFAAPVVPKLELHEMGKGAAAINGPWQFHLGDDPSWANPKLDDSQWEQIKATEPWGSQGHPSYWGYAWYRKHIDITPAPGASQDFALLIPAIVGIYEIYWNGTLIGHLGSYPPHSKWYPNSAGHTFGLGPIREGVLAVRVYLGPPSSNTTSDGGGFVRAPFLGSPDAIGALKSTMDYTWLQQSQFRFGLTTLYTLTAVLSFLAWLRDRRQRLLLWMAAYTVMPLLELYIRGMHLPIPGSWATFLIQSEIQLREASQWFLLLWLLQLNTHAKLNRFVRIAAIITVVAGALDGSLAFEWGALGPLAFEGIDAFLTVFLLAFEVIPAILMIFAAVRGQKLNASRWVVAILAATNALWYSVSNFAAQGVRFTHWTLANAMGRSLFTLFGSTFPMQAILRLLLFVAFVYAVFRYSIDSSRRQRALEQEFQNARELQQVLVPEDLPAIPGYALTTAYKPASEVGGDFFQIIPIKNGSTLIVLGDVSGKGLKAAMAVSLIVGAIRTFAEITDSPAEVLCGLNRRLFGRMQGGFATAIALRLDADGSCVMASAGHTSPFINEREVDLPGAIPLGLAEDAVYTEQALQLHGSEHLALYTDGLLEARNATGELYSFERLKTLFATQPTAEEATEAAVAFGQDDDITVLTLNRWPVPAMAG